MLDHPARPEDGAALCAERLRQRHGRHHVGLADQAGLRDGTAAAVAEYAEAVCVVDHQCRAVRAARLVQLAQRGQVTVHREHRVRHHECAFGAAGLEGVRDGRHVAVFHHRDVGAGQAAAVDQRRVQVGVGHDRGALAGQRGDRAHVRHEARREHQCRLCTAELRQLVLQLDVCLGGARDQARSGRTRAPAQRGGRGGAGDPLVAGQAEVVVAREVQHVGVGAAGTQLPGEPGAAAFVRAGVEPVENRGHDVESDSPPIAARSRPCWQTDNSSA